MRTDGHSAELAACFGCDSGTADALSAIFTARVFQHHDPIAHQGDVAAQLFLVLDGATSVEIFGVEGQQAQLARHGPGEIFGAYPVPSLHRANITAIGKTYLLLASTAELARLAHGNAAVASGVASLLARQLDLVLDRMAARIGLSATGRFYRALLLLADANGRIHPAPVIAALAVSVHTSRETASRALATLLRRGIIERVSDGLRIVSRRMLEELVV